MIDDGGEIVLEVLEGEDGRYGCTHLIEPELSAGLVSA
jgi:hypothetical protein